MTSQVSFTPDFKSDPWWWEAARPRLGAEASLPERADVCVIGGGYAGLNCALEVARGGASCVVLDAGLIGAAASSRNGGLVSGGLKLASMDLERRMGAERAERIESEAVGTLRFLEDLIAREKIDCDLNHSGRFICAWSKADYDAMAARAGKLATLTCDDVTMIPPERQREEIGSDYYRGGQLVAAAATLHPAKYVAGLAEAARRAGAILIGLTQVEGLERDAAGWRARTARGDVRARSVMLATNAYTGEEFSWFRRRVVPVASFMIATEDIPDDLARELAPKSRAMADSRRVLSYFRLSPDRRRVLWGGRVGVAAMDPRESARRLHAMMTRVWPQLKATRVSHCWTGDVAFTFDFVPHLGAHEGVHYALGCQGNGVAMQSWLGQRAGAAILSGAFDCAFADRPFPTAPLYRGEPWFLPAMLWGYRIRDAIDRVAS